ncbi:usp6 n-terminal-like protein [Stylonychia lemnae]|uniref:Usp6 n-terminal-like protein n=1 Tax=Stylonychia lemnae TaxID=5949 RepID=A0A078A8C0_STYLE|nr:usp6 n-terminal-like protein [Stylonychia lemnae]|eukprot:CDW78116.1 usp6 n-terminal-like protein [Stylonychia lemnae]
MDHIESKLRLDMNNITIDKNARTQKNSEQKPTYKTNFQSFMFSPNSKEKQCETSRFPQFKYNMTNQNQRQLPASKPPVPSQLLTSRQGNSKKDQNQRLKSQRNDTLEQDIKVKPKRQRNLTQREKQIQRYDLVLANDEEDDDDCNISCKSKEECPINQNEQRKLEIQRQVFKIFDTNDSEFSRQYIFSNPSVRESFSQKARNLSRNPNTSIVQTKRVPSMKNLRLFSQQDDDSLKPVDTQDMLDEEDEEEYEELLKTQKVEQKQKQSFGISELSDLNLQKETQPSLSNQTNHETPKMNARQKQLQQVSNYLNQYQNNLFTLTTELKNEFKKKDFKPNLVDYNKSKDLYIIKKDVQRTFQEEKLFQIPQDDKRYDYTRNPLFNVLVAYSISDSKLGYTQGNTYAFFNNLGMNYIAGLFYMIFQDEYESFIALNYIMNVLNWRCVYLDNTPKLQNLMLIVQKKVYNECPKIYAHMQEYNVKNRFPKIIQILPSTVYSQIFITLGLYNCKIEHAMSIVDLFLLEGEKALFKLIINCMKLKQKKILSFNQDFVILISQFNSQELTIYLQRDLLSECLTEYGFAQIFEDCE